MIEVTPPPGFSFHRLLINLAHRLTYGQKAHLYDWLALAHQVEASESARSELKERVEPSMSSVAGARIARYLIRIAEDGYPISRGMRALSRIFAPWEIQLVAMGETTEQPSAAFSQLKQLCRRRKQARDAIRNMSVYPVILFVILFFVSGIYFIKVYPTLSVFYQTEWVARPPLLSLVLICFRYFWIFAGLAVILGLTIWQLDKSAAYLRGWRALRDRLFLTPLRRNEGRTLCCSVLQAHLAIGSSVEKALESAAACQPNRWLAFRLRRSIREALRAGNLWPLARSGVIDRTLVRILSASVDDELLAARLHTYEVRALQRLKYQSESKLRFLEYLIIFCTGLVVATIVVAFYQGILTVTVPSWI